MNITPTAETADVDDYVRPTGPDQAVHTGTQQHYLVSCGPGRGDGITQALATCHCGRDLLGADEDQALAAFDGHIRDLLTQPGHWTPAQAYVEGYRDGEGVLLAYVSGRAAGAQGPAQQHLVQLYVDLELFARSVNPFRRTPPGDEAVAGDSHGEATDPASAALS